MQYNIKNLKNIYIYLSSNIQNILKFLIKDMFLVYKMFKKYLNSPKQLNLLISYKKHI